MPLPTPFDHILFKIEMAFSDANIDPSSCVASDLYWLNLHETDMLRAKTKHDFEAAAARYDKACRAFFTLGYVRQNAEVK